MVRIVVTEFEHLCMDLLPIRHGAGVQDGPSLNSSCDSNARGRRKRKTMIKQDFL